MTHREYIGLTTVAKKNINYPSPGNPRIEGLNANDPKIQELAASIKNHGLQYPPVLRRKGNQYEPIDGDRRLIALFDVLNKDSVQAMVWKVDDETVVNYMRLAANWDREDFSPLEKGAYLWRILYDEMEKDGKVPVETYWKQREIRSEYTIRLSNAVAKPRSTIARHISLWLEIPEHYRKRIARSRDEIRDGKVSPRKALDISIIGKKLRNPERVWAIFIPKEGPVEISTREITVMKKAVSLGQVKNAKQLEEFRKEKAPEWVEQTILLKNSEAETAAKLASTLEVEISKVYRGSILLANEQPEELRKHVGEI